MVMRKFVFAVIVISYGIVSSIVMLPLSIIMGLFSMFFDFWAGLFDGIKAFNREYNESIAASKKAFTWADYNPNNEPKDPK